MPRAPAAAAGTWAWAWASPGALHAVPSSRGCQTCSAGGGSARAPRRDSCPGPPQERGGGGRVAKHPSSAVLLKQRKCLHSLSLSRARLSCSLSLPAHTLFALLFSEVRRGGPPCLQMWVRFSVSLCLGSDSAGESVLGWGLRPGLRSAALSWVDGRLQSTGEEEEDDPASPLTWPCCSAPLP